MNRSLLFTIMTVLTLLSCFEEDERVGSYEGKVTLIADSVQLYQSFFDFETGRVVKSVSIDSWHLGFECGETGWHIVTNSGAGWFIFNTGQTLPDAAENMPESIDHLFDMPSLFPDSTAVGDWVSFEENAKVYSHNLYLLGYHTGDHFTGIKRIVFLEVNDSAYRFFYKEQISGKTDTITVIKDESVNYVYYDFESNQQVTLEPDKSEWDLAFGPYYDLATLFGVTIPYLVGGSFLNEGQTEAVLDSVTSFQDIKISMVSDYQFMHQRDIPGYKWKGVTVDVTGGSASYAVKSHYNYIFHTSANNFYKLKFLSYTLDGRSGFPQFEFERLE